MTTSKTTRRDRVNSTGDSNQCGDTLVSDGDVQSIIKYLTRGSTRSISPIVGEFRLIQAYVYPILGVLADAGIVNYEDDSPAVELIEASGGDFDVK